MSRISTLRRRIQDLNADGALVFRTNRFLDTYGVREDENCVEHLVQFTGSSATLWVSLDSCVLFTDSRYYDQAHQECKGVAEVLDFSELVSYLRNHSQRIVVDPWHLSAQRFDQLRYQLSPCQVIAEELFQETHTVEAPQAIFPIPNLGRACQDWQHHMQHPILVTRSEDLSFLCRLATKNAYLPALKGYGIGQYNAKKNVVTWHIGLPQHDVSHLPTFPHIQFFSIEDWKSWVCRSISLDSIGYFPEYTPLALLHWFPEMKPISWDIPQRRCRKTAQELEAIQGAHIWEGAAFTTLLYRLIQAYWKQELSEWDIVLQLELLRAQCPYYEGPSFPTISAMGASGAMIHYVPKPCDARTITHGPYLIDAGGQYRWSTTDMTRSVWLGDREVDPLYQEDYTAVLKGHIDVALQIFPKNTRAACLDVVARSALWRECKNYEHSTGHGVGCFSNVHEGPIALSQNSASVLEPGMVCSNEPGMYRKNHWGIRLENVYCIEAHSQQAGWMNLRYLSLAPFQRALIQPDKLGSERLQWLNTYHQYIFETLADLVEPSVREWLRSETAPF